MRRRPAKAQAHVGVAQGARAAGVAGQGVRHRTGEARGSAAPAGGVGETDPPLGGPPPQGTRPPPTGPPRGAVGRGGPGRTAAREVAREAEARFGSLGPFSPADIAGLVGLSFLGGESVILLGDAAWGARVRGSVRRVGGLIRVVGGTGGPGPARARRSPRRAGLGAGRGGPADTGTRPVRRRRLGGVAG